MRRRSAPRPSCVCAAHERRQCVCVCAMCVLVCGLAWMRVCLGLALPQEVCVCGGCSAPSPYHSRGHGGFHPTHTHEPRGKGKRGGTQHASSYTHALPCVCDPHTLCAGSHALPGGLLSLRKALLGPNRAWEHCPWQEQARHTLCSVCEARTHVCAGLHTTLGGHLSFREALLGPSRAWDTCP